MLNLGADFEITFDVCASGLTDNEIVKHSAYFSHFVDSAQGAGEIRRRYH